MRIVVTGGAGLIGSWLTRELVAHEHEVTVFDRVKPAELPKGATYKLGDHDDQGGLYDVLRGHDAVVHLSAIPAVYYHPQPLVFRTNVLGTYYVAEAAGRLGLRIMVTASSINALGIGMAERKMEPLELPIDETHPLRPQDAYSLSKVIDEQTVAALHRRTGLRTIAIRPPLVAWPERFPSLIPDLADPGLRHRVLWSYVDVRDLAVGFRLAVESQGVEQDAFFIVADDALAREPLAELMPRYYPSTGEMAKVLTGTRPAVVNERAKRVLGFQPRWSWRDFE
jgi:nucleoside-diphosphate-sugar epimerase